MKRKQNENCLPELSCPQSWKRQAKQGFHMPQKVGIRAALLLAQSGYEQAQSALALQEVSMKSADAKLAAGTITKNTYESQKASYTTAQVTARTQKLSLLQAMNDYDWAVNGLASAE